MNDSVETEKRSEAMHMSEYPEPVEYEDDHKGFERSNEKRITPRQRYLHRGGGIGGGKGPNDSKGSNERRIDSHHHHDTCTIKPNNFKSLIENSGYKYSDGGKLTFYS